MALTLVTGSDSLNTTFTPTAGVFMAQSTGGACVLQRRASGSDAWADCGLVDGSVDVPNELGQMDYKFVAYVAGTSPVVRAYK